MSSLAAGAFGQRRFENMVAIDEMVVALAEELEAVGRVNETYTIFALPPPQARNSLNASFSRSIHSSVPMLGTHALGTESPLPFAKLLSFP